MPRRNQQTAAPVEQPAEEARETQRQDPPRLLRNMLHNPRRRHRQPDREILLPAVDLG